mmetsp:Transcript_39456/g.91551  ORF Transcript_39456/g.91551 Transcript_39456/m.91551 type:complete len:580 (+) Transcript_39456:14-1753(+)
MKMQWAQLRALAAIAALTAPAAAARAGRSTATRELRGQLQNVASLLEAEASQEGTGQQPPQPAAPEGDFEQSADAALVYIHERLAAASHESAQLRQQVAQAQGREQELSQQLSESEHNAKVQEQQAHALLEKTKHEDGLQLAAEKSREEQLGERMHNLSVAFALRGQSLDVAEAKIEKGQREAGGFRQALQLARNESGAMRKRLAVAVGNLAELRQELAAGKQELEASKESWHIAEMKMQQAGATQQAELDESQTALRKEREEVEALQEASKGEEGEISKLKRVAAEKSAELAAEHRQAKLLQGQEELRVRSLEQRVAVLIQALKLHQKRFQEEREHKSQLAQQLHSLQSRTHVELSNLTKHLAESEAEQKRYASTNSVLAHELQGNVTESSQLRQQVAALRKRLAEGERARQQAESASQQAQEKLEHEQAVAKQLAGTVPRLLEQTRLAHEARDAEKALRAKAQASAQRQLERLQNDYASVMQGELEQMDFKTTGLGGNASAELPPADDLTATVGSAVDEAQVPEDDASLSLKAQAPGDDLAEPGAAAKSTDLPRDSQGLASLAGEDDDGSHDTVEPQ